MYGFECFGVYRVFSGTYCGIVDEWWIRSKVVGCKNKWEGVPSTHTHAHARARTHAHTRVTYHIAVAIVVNAFGNFDKPRDR